MAQTFFLYAVIFTEYVRMDPGCLSVCLCVCVSVCVSVCPEPFGETTGPISTKLSKNSLTQAKGCAFQFEAIWSNDDVMAAIL